MKFVGWNMLRIQRSPGSQRAGMASQCCNIGFVFAGGDMLMSIVSV